VQLQKSGMPFHLKISPDLNMQGLDRHKTFCKFGMNLKLFQVTIQKKMKKKKW